MKPVPPASTAVREVAAIEGRVRRVAGFGVMGARAQGRCGVKVELSSTSLGSTGIATACLDGTFRKPHLSERE